MFHLARHYFQLARGMRTAIRYPGHQNFEETILEQLRNREARFLDLLRRIVFANPANPFFLLLREAGCTLGDIEHLIAERGLEATLEKLRTAGVYVSQDEFKGRQPIVRGGKRFPVGTSDFVNPLTTGAFTNQTGGSTGPATSVPVNLKNVAYRECHRGMALRQFGAMERSVMTLAPILPSPHGFTRPIWTSKWGLRWHRWFGIHGNRPEVRVYRAATRVLLAELKLLGVPVPPLEFLPANDFTPVAREIASERARGKFSLVEGSANACVRIATAAIDHGLDISGARFWTTGEGLSTAKAAEIRRAGAESYAAYWTAEVGSVGFGCSHYEGQNTVHHFRDASAVIAARQMWAPAGVEVNALYFTTLLPFAPFFAINLEIGDQGELMPARCDCAFHRIGYHTVITKIASYAKLTGHGATLVGTDIVRILEEFLPARFGGSSSDYQLVEEEQGAQTKLVLRVNPRLGQIQPGEIEAFFLAEVRKLFGGSLSVSIWNHAGAVRVVSAPLLAGRTGKILPLHVLGRRAYGDSPLQDLPPRNG